VPPRIGDLALAFSWSTDCGLRLLDFGDTLALAPLGRSIEASGLQPPAILPGLRHATYEGLRVPAKARKHTCPQTKVLWAPFADPRPTHGDDYCDLVV
jgi:hypothetical protein